MATKLYLESSGTAPLTPTPDGGWTDTSQYSSFPAGTTKTSSTLTTKNISDSSNTQGDVLIGQWVSHPLDGGQTITGAQTIQIVALFSETAANNNLFMSWVVTVVNSAGVVQKTLIAKRNDGTEVVASTLTSRTDSASSTAGNYTTTAGDRIIIEVGLEGDPTGSNNHNGAMRYGSASGSDLAYSDGVTTDNNPSVQLTDTLTFNTSSASASLSPSSSASASRSPSASLSPSSSISPSASLSPSASASPPPPIATFMEPGGDATFNVAATTAGGFYAAITNSPTIVTDIVHGGHIKSIQFNNLDHAQVGSSTNRVLNDSGSRISAYFYFVSFAATELSYLFRLFSSGDAIRWGIVVTSGGVIQRVNSTGVQIGSNGSTLSTGQWYRISIAYTTTSASINRLEVFVDGVSVLSQTNVDLSGLTDTAYFTLSFAITGAARDFRINDIYVDSSDSLIDTGDIWVTAKRPFSNGTTNGFTTQIGASGSGYGSGHSPQVNERALSTTNGWSMVGAGSAVTEEYNIESASTGDINISSADVIDWMGWAYMSSLASETVQLIVGGTNNATAITSTNTMYTVMSHNTNYPAGTGSDIGITTDTSLTTVSLYECGIVIAYVPGSPATSIPNRIYQLNQTINRSNTF